MHTMPSQKACTDLPPMQSLQVFVVLSLIFIRFDHEQSLFLFHHFIPGTKIIGPQIRETIFLNIQNQNWAFALIFGTVTEVRLQKNQISFRIDRKIHAKIHFAIEYQLRVLFVFQYRKKTQITAHGCFINGIQAAQSIALGNFVKPIVYPPQLIPIIPVVKLRKIKFPIRYRKALVIIHCDHLCFFPIVRFLPMSMFFHVNI
jgi:hypothetical protein